MADPAALSILMVEDDRFVADALADALEETGRVLVERDGAAAMAALDRQRFDVVLCDWMLPDGPPSRVIAKAMVNAVPVIMMTGDVAVAERLAAEGRAVLAKPFKLEDLRLKLLGVGCTFPQGCAAG